jgi:hypothetical protein
MHTAPLVRSALAGMLSPLPIHHRASHRRSAGAKRRQVTDHIAPKAHIPLRGLCSISRPYVRPPPMPYSLGFIGSRARDADWRGARIGVL